MNTFINTLLDPAPLESLYAAPFTSGEIFVDVFRTPGEEPKQIQLLHIFPFMTIFDIKLAIYAYFLEQGDERAHPDFVFIGSPKFGDGKNLETINYNWSFSATPNKPVYLHSPIDIASGRMEHDVRFVEANGSRKNIRRTDTERVTLENKFSNRIPRIKAFFYDALESLIPGERPLGELEWNGRLYPYFPALSLGNDTLTDEQKKSGRKMANNFLLRSNFFQKMERDFVRVDRPLPPLKLSAVHYLRLNYLKTQDFTTGVEIVFYETPVNKHRPYMRLMPVESTPISKIHMFENSDEPNLEEPKLLYSWSQEKNPTPERDYVMAKILLRKKDLNKTPLYSTLRLFDDGTADITVEPPKPLKKLSPTEDLSNIGERLKEGLEGIAHLRGLPLLKNASLTFSMNTQGYFNIPSTPAEFREKLPIMSAIFQEIPSIEKERTFITLRYKLVSNYSREDSIQVYITQLLAQQTLEGEQDPKEIIGKIRKEFQLSATEAREQYAKNLEATSDFILTNPETKDYNSFQDTGVDITVYQFSKIFLFRLYRVDSYETIQRILTFLSILFGVPAGELKIEGKDITAFEEGDKVLGVRAEESIGRAEEEARDTAVEQEGSEDEFQSVDGEKEITGSEAGLEEGVDGFEGDAPDYFDLMEEPEGTTLEEIEEEAIQTTTLRMFTPTIPRPTVPVTVLPKKADTGPIKGVETYFSEKLKEADRSLFDFHKTHPDLKKYVTQCASNLTRQPAALTFEQLELMKEEYAEELSKGIIKFYIFPLDKDAKKDAYDPPKEYYTIMRYGSSPTNQNYYLCSEFFCIRDEMLVRRVELQGTQLRPKHYVKLANGSDRTTKDPNTCPMCEGGLITNRRFPGVNQTIIERTVKAGTQNGRHLFIRFLKKTNHPDGLYLPCCFLEDQPLRYGDPQFPEPTQEIFQERREVAISPEEEEEMTQVEGDQKSPIPYQAVLYMAKTASIVGVEKMPLDPEIKKLKKTRRSKSGAYDESEKVTEYVPPQIGLLPTKINEYFSQNPIDIVSRTFNPQKLKPKSKGFLRVGVENRGMARSDSFLAAVAPFFHCNSAKELKEVIADRIQPRLFMGLNFGNLLLEFYDPMLKRENKKQPTDSELADWGQKYLKMSRISIITNTNRIELVKRAYISYNNFRSWLFTQEIKEYRQFAHFFSLPGIMRVDVEPDPETGVRNYYRPGIIFIVLEILSSGELKVHCPPYPISDDMYESCDIGFIMKHYSGVWEPIFYYNNDSDPYHLENKAKLTFSTGKKPSWPDIVQKRFDEFRSQCAVKSENIGIYASNYKLRSDKVPPLAVVRKVLDQHKGIKLYGLLRDSYNHVAALVYQGNKGGLVAVPVIEDGMSYSSNTDVPGKSSLHTLILDVQIIMDWTGYTPGTVQQVVEFYNEFLIKDPELSKFYTIKRYVKRRKSNDSTRNEAIQLISGIFIPVVPPAKFSPIPKFLKEPKEVEEYEWEINRKIINSNSDSDQNLPEVKTKELEEAFQHLRITFSNWLNSTPRGGLFRDNLQKILTYRFMPIYEKRKRLEIILGPILQQWIENKNENAEFHPSILRVDCTSRPKEGCKGTCSWSQEREKCLIHAASKKNPNNGKPISGARVMLLRLIEELLRFTNKRREIFKKQLSRIAILDNPVREGEQYIVPEKSAAWTELLRSEWSLASPETPRYIEEMRIPPKQASLAPITDPTELPVTLKTLFGSNDPLTARLRLYVSPTGTIAGLLPVLPEITPDSVGINQDDIALNDKTLPALVKQTKFPVIQYDLRVDPPQIAGNKLMKDLNNGYAVFILQEKPALVVVNPSSPAVLKKEELPAELLKEMIGLKIIFNATPK